jgi:hypothetical protein
LVPMAGVGYLATSMIYTNRYTVHLQREQLVFRKRAHCPALDV